MDGKTGLLHAFDYFSHMEKYALPGSTQCFSNGRVPYALAQFMGSLVQPPVVQPPVPLRTHPSLINM